MSTQFNFPANPNVGDTFTMPNGIIAQWNGTEWLSVSDASANVTYPLGIVLGGTGANAAPQARINLGLNAATGEFIVQKDGTAALPGIAFASEPGLGWYREGAGKLSFADAGAKQIAHDFSVAASAGIAVYPRAAGSSTFQLNADPAGTVNTTVLNLSAGSSGGTIASAGVGSGLAKQLAFAGATFAWNTGASTVMYLDPSQTNITNSTWYSRTAAGTAQLNLVTAPSGVSPYQQLTIGMAPAGATLTSSGSSGRLPINFVSSKVVMADELDINADAGGSAILSLNKKTGGNGNTISGYTVGVPRWTLQLGDGSAESGSDAGSNVSLYRYNDAGTINGTPVLNISRATGATTFAGLITTNSNPIWCSTNEFGLVRTAGVTHKMQFTVDNWRLEFAIATNTLQFVQPNNNVLWRQQGDGTMVIYGHGYQPGGGPWGDTSDVRIKDDIIPYTTGLNAILALQPVSYSFKAGTGRDTTKRHIRLIAQDAMQAMPELVTIKPGECGDIKLDDMHELDEGPVLWALVNAVKTLNARLAALEH